MSYYDPVIHYDSMEELYQFFKCPETGNRDDFVIKLRGKFGLSDKELILIWQAFDIAYDLLIVANNQAFYENRLYRELFEETQNKIIKINCEINGLRK